MRGEIMTTLVPRPFGGLVREAEKRDIGKTKAFEFAKEGLLETFKIGNRKYVYIDSIDTLPQRIAAREGASA
jgi:hypothetical protein